MPFTFNYDPKADFVVTFELPGGTRLDLATLFIPAGATDFPAKLSVSFPLPATSYADGDMDLNVTLTGSSNGSRISILNQAMELRTWTPTGIPNLRDETNNDFPMQILVKPELVDGVDSGYYQFLDGAIQIVSKRLSLFTTLKSGGNGVTSGNSDDASKTPSSRINSTRKAWDRNALLYAYFNSQPYVLVDLRNAFAGQEATIQLRRYIRGGTTYINLGRVTLSESGNATYELQSKLLKRDRLRLLVDGQKIVFHNVMSS